uniref:Uncharacterized protein n=1 Tax=Triticum urartu TaxID=4572 RepID=A0A8R7UJB9_TRIUA
GAGRGLAQGPGHGCGAGAAGRRGRGATASTSTTATSEEPLMTRMPKGDPVEGRRHRSARIRVSVAGREAGGFGRSVECRVEARR